MAEPARSDDADPGPYSRAMAPVRNLLANAAEAARLAAADLAGAPDCPTAQRRIEMICSALADLAEITRMVVVDEAILEAWGDERYAQGVADARAARCRMQVVGGG